MKNILISILVIALTSTSYSQNSGSGTLEWWTSTCLGQVCDREIDSEDIYWIVAPQDGDLEVTGSTTGLTATCHSCMLTSNPIASTVFKPSGLGLGSFTSSPTITINCLAAGDSIGVRFFTIGTGYYGNYQFSSNFLPNTHGNDIEPNDTKETAQVIPLNSSIIEGHTYYGVETRDASDFFEIGTFQMGDSIHWSISGNAGYFALHRLGAAAVTSMGNLVNSQNSYTGHHIVSHDDIYFIAAVSLGSAPCGHYQIVLSGDKGDREYVLSSDGIGIHYYPFEDSFYIGGDFTNKSIEITNVTNVVVQNLTGISSPIMFDIHSLPAGKHFLVIRDQVHPLLEIQDLIKE